MNCSKRPGSFGFLFSFFFFAILLNDGLKAQTDTLKYKVQIMVRNVSDSTPIAAADVMVKGTSISTVTDESGLVKWELMKKDSILLITCPGYFPEEVNAFLDDSLRPIVYLAKTPELRNRGNQLFYPLSTFPGSRAGISGNVYQQGNFSTVENGFQGQVAGMHVIQSSGNLNSYSSVLLRGVGTSILGTEPLYVIDGIPVTSGSLGDGGGGIGNNYGYNTTPLSEFNSYDVQSVEVLKSGAATAVYGGRGANGVILVSTKRGVAGKTRLNIGYQHGITTPTNRLELLDGSSYVRAMDESYKRSFDANPANASLTLPGRDYYLNNGTNRYLTNPVASSTNTDWLDKSLQTGFHRQLDLSASGGNKLVRFFFGGNYTMADGIQKNNSNNRLSVRFNTDVTISPSFRFGSSLFFSFASGYFQPSGNSSLGGGFGDAQTTALPIAPIRFDARNEVLNPYRASNPFFNAYDGNNIVLLTDKTHSKYDRQIFRNLGNIYAETDIKKIPGLKLRGDFGFDYYSNFDRTFRSDMARLGSAVDANNQPIIIPSAQASDNRSIFFNLSISGLASYSKAIDQHSFRLFAGYSGQSITNTYNGIASENFPSSYSQLVSFGSRFSGLPVGAETGVSFVNHFYGVDYSFSNKYFLNLTSAFTASTRYGSNIGFVLFPSATLGWDMKKEDFLADIAWMKSARLQFSSSVTGNSLMTNNQASGYWKGFLPYIDAGQFPGRYPFSLSSTELAPEKNRTHEVELSLGIFDDVVVGTLGYFHRKTTNAAQFYPLAPSQGIAGSAFVRNGAQIINHGFELGLETRNLRRGNFVWKSMIQVATLANTFSSSDGLRDDQTNEFLGLASIQNQGTSTFYLPRSAGFANSDDPGGKWKKGDELILDKNGNPFKPASLSEIDDARVAISGKSTLPKFYGGVNNVLSYNKFQLDFLFTFSMGNYLLDAGERFQSYMTGQSNLRKDAVNENLYFIRQDDSLISYSNLLAQRNTTRFLHNASYVRLKNIGLTYLLKGLKGSFARFPETRIFLRAQNLLTFTSFKGWDPEALTNSQINNTRATSIGSTFFDVPQYRTILLGFNITL